jgi:hypothetical protein
MEEPMSEEINLNWRTRAQRPALKALLAVETEHTTLRKVEFLYAERETVSGDLVWVFAYWYGVEIRNVRVNVLKVKRWAYETDESVAELDQFAHDMVVDTLKNEVERLEKRVAGARYELEKDKAPATAEVELAIHNALRYLSGEIEREGRP